MHFMNAFIFLLSLAFLQDQEDLPVLRVGETVKGVIKDGDAIFHTEILDRDYTYAPTLGKQYVVQISEPGHYYIDMKSLFLNAYLVLRNKDGKILVEDDDGLYGNHSRIIFKAQEGVDEYILNACALQGMRGKYEVQISKGNPAEHAHWEKQEAGIRDVRKMVLNIEEREGKESPALAMALNNLASLFKAQGNYGEARPLLERALKICEKSCGPEHRSTAISIHNLAMLLRTQGKYEEARPLLERALKIFEKVYGPEHRNTAISIHNLALLLEDQGKYEEARPLFERALKICEKVFGPKDSNTAACLYGLASLLHTQGNYEEAKPLYERSLAIREKVLGPEHPRTATILKDLAMLFKDQGNYKEAKPLCERSLAIREKVFGPEHPRTAASLNALAALFEDQGNYKEAKPLYERALRIYEKVFGPEHPRTGTVLNNLASLLQNQGDYNEAQFFYERSLAIREKVFGPDHPSTASGLNNLAALLVNQGKYAEAKPLIERALHIREQVLGPEHPDTAISLNYVGRLHEVQENYEEAKVFYGRALRIWERVLGPEHPDFATGLTFMAGVLEAQGNYEKAESFYERALAIREKVLGPEHPDFATGLTYMADVLEAQGNYEKAETFYKKALEIWEQSLGPEHPRTALILNNLAGLHSAQGKYEEARTLYWRAMEIVEKVFGPEHPDAAICLNNLAGLLSDIGEDREAWELSKKAITSGEKQESHLLWSRSEHERLLYAAQKQWYLCTLLSSAEKIATIEAERTAYNALLRWKGLASRSMLQSKESLSRELNPKARKSLSSLKGVQSKLSKALYAQKMKDREIYEKRLRCLRRERLNLETELLRNLGGAEEELDLSALRLKAALPEASAIVDFYVHRWYEPAVRIEGKMIKKAQWSVLHLSGWILKKNREELIHLEFGPAKPIKETIATFREALKISRGISISKVEGPSPWEIANDALRSLLWAPISEYVKDAKTVFVSPDQFLGTIPFEVLQNGNGAYLIENHAFVYIQDMVSLVQITKEEKRAKEKDANLLVIGGVDYRKMGDLAWREGEKEESLPAETEDAMISSNLLAQEDVRGKFPSQWGPLPATRYESATLADMHEEAFEEKGKRLLLQGGTPTEERLKYELPHYSILHLATHGFFQPEGLPSMWEQAKNEAGKMEMFMKPEIKRLTGMLPGLLSGLVCAGVNKPIPEKERDDGFLTAEEISWLDLSNVDLVVLSACETGLGKAKSGEGMIGLRRTFRQAGAKTVISSLWNVGDETTSELMQNFYHRLWLKGESKLNALRNAQLDMLKKNRIEHNGNGFPVTWGAFVLDGDWR